MYFSSITLIIFSFFGGYGSGCAGVCVCVEGGGEVICPGDEWGVRAQETSMYTIPAWFGLYLRYCTLQKNVLSIIR